MELFIQGLGIGLVITAMIGPITLTILDSSLTAGWQAGLITAAAMWTSDILYIAASFYGGTQLLQFVHGQRTDIWVDVAAGCVMIGIGLVLLRMRGAGRRPISELRDKKAMTGHFFRGFVVNSFSPFTAIFWPTITMSMVSEQELSFDRSVLLYGGILLALSAGDTLKAIFAGWLRRWISQRYLKYSRTVIAAVFLGIGVFLFGKSAFAYFV